MKIKPLSLITTALLFSGASLQANDLPNGSVPFIIINPTPICGGADDDQNTKNPKWAPLCGGMDDDQLKSTPSPQPPPQPNPPHVAVAKLDQLDEASIIAILIGMLHGDEDGEPLHGNDGDDTLSDFAMWEALTGPTQPAPHGIESDSFGLWGDGQTDSITGDGGADMQSRLQQAVLEICGGNGNDSITGSGGADSLYGGNGGDTLVHKLASFVVGNTGADRFIGDLLDVGSITGDLGNDTFRPTNRIARLQQVAFSVGVRSDINHLSGIILSTFTGDSMDDDDLWGGGGTDEIVGGDGADF